MVALINYDCSIFQFGKKKRERSLIDDLHRFMKDCKARVVHRQKVAAGTNSRHERPFPIVVVLCWSTEMKQAIAFGTAE